MVIFSYTTYRRFLHATFPQKGVHRGQRVKLAKYLNCQPSFLSLVITERAHLSAEALHALSEYLQFSEEEREYLFVIYHFERAGSADLKKYYRRQMERHQKRRTEVHARVNAKSELPTEVQAQYYSQWYYAAIHTALLVVHLRTPEVLAQHFKLELLVVKEALQFLEKWGLARQENGAYTSGVMRLHLPKTSKFISQHHKNWNLEVMKSMDRLQDQQLHYSGVIAVAEKDYEALRNILLSAVSEMEKIIASSNDQKVAAFSINLFDWG